MSHLDVADLCRRFQCHGWTLCRAPDASGMHWAILDEGSAEWPLPESTRSSLTALQVAARVLEALEERDPEAARDVLRLAS